MSTEKGGYVCDYCSGGVDTHTVGMKYFDCSEKKTFNSFEDLAQLQGAEEEVID
ncbi:MAG: hypothetical protein HUJ51_06605 [Eggerthellaceae bacterium]|nr:hypothetical protein [Eggerthellaceae bacterium]